MTRQWDGMQPMQPPCITPAGKCRRKDVRKSHWLDDILDALRRLEIQLKRRYSRTTRWIDEVWYPRAYERITGKWGEGVCTWVLVATVAVFAVYLAQWGWRGFPR